MLEKQEKEYGWLFETLPELSNDQFDACCHMVEALRNTPVCKIDRFRLIFTELLRKYIDDIDFSYPLLRALSREADRRGRDLNYITLSRFDNLQISKSRPIWSEF